MLMCIRFNIDEQLVQCEFTHSLSISHLIIYETDPFFHRTLCEHLLATIITNRFRLVIVHDLTAHSSFVRQKSLSRYAVKKRIIPRIETLIMETGTAPCLVQSTERGQFSNIHLVQLLFFEHTALT